MGNRGAPFLRGRARLVGFAALGACLILGGCATSSGAYPYGWSGAPAPEYGYQSPYDASPYFYGVPDEGPRTHVEPEEEERESAPEEPRETPRQERQEEQGEHGH